MPSRPRPRSSPPTGPGEKNPIQDRSSSAPPTRASCCWPSWMAHVSLDLYAEVLRDPQLLDALAAAAERGVHVRIIVSPSGDFGAEADELTASGVEIRLSSSLYIHAKLIVDDGERAF